MHTYPTVCCILLIWSYNFTIRREHRNPSLVVQKRKLRLKITEQVLCQDRRRVEWPAAIGEIFRAFEASFKSFHGAH